MKTNFPNNLYFERKEYILFIKTTYLFFVYKGADHHESANTRAKPQMPDSISILLKKISQTIWRCIQGMVPHIHRHSKGSKKLNTN